MVKQADFAVEQYMDKYETGIEFNLGETCCHSMTIEEVSNLAQVGPADSLVNDILTSRLTYGHIRGSPELKSIISEQIYEGTGLSQDNIVITNGAIGANFLTFYTIVDKEDHIVVVDPSYQQLSSVPEMFGGNVELLKLKFEDKYLPDLKYLRETVTKNKTKLVVINNPHNPTGVVWGNDILGEIVEICRENDCYIFCDEVYRPLYHSVEKAPSSILSFGYEKAISTSSMSKAFSFAGLRLGWIATNDSKLSERFFSKRDYNMISISMIDDKIATFILTHHKKILERNYQLCKDNLDTIQKFIDQLNGKLEWVRPQGGATCFIKVNAKGSKSTMEIGSELAEKHKVLVVPGEVFNHPGFLRVGFGNSKKEIEEGFPIILEYLDSL